MKNKKTKVAIISVIALILVTIGITYAYWLVTKTQTGENEISSACLDIAISGEKNDIELTNQFPMSDEDGMKLVPYEFTVTNNCNTSIDYQVALEATGTESSAITTSSLKVALNDTVTLLSSNSEIDTTVSGAYESRRLMVGTLAASGNEGSTATYNLRIWIDENAPISEMSKTFKSKISVTVGQGVINPIKEGTLAYSILANYGEVENIEEISYELLPQSFDDVEIEEDWFDDAVNYWYGTSYSYDSSTQQFSLTGDLVQATFAECKDGTKTCGKYTLKSSEENGTASSVFELLDMSSNIVNTKKITLINEFTTGSKEGEVGIYKAPDDYGISYYFRGNPTNNYVTFGSEIKYEGCYEADVGSCTTEVYFETETACLEEYDYCSSRSVNNSWRIVRINGDGTIRMIYSDIIGEGNYNNSSSKYVGYMFGTTSDLNANTNDSAIKDVLDTWYSKNLKGTPEEYIADSIFCNDREVSSIHNGTTYYMSNIRIEQSKPKLTCKQQNDRFTVNDTMIGNAALTYPIGLLSVDEIMMAGGTTYTSNNTHYLYSSEEYWTMTPLNSLESGASVWDSGMTAPSVTQSGVYPDYRPVINLKADVKFTGNGTIDNPYKIVTE